MTEQCDHPFVTAFRAETGKLMFHCAECDKYLTVHPDDAAEGKTGNGFIDSFTFSKENQQIMNEFFQGLHTLKVAAYECKCSLDEFSRVATRNFSPPRKETIEYQTLGHSTAKPIVVSEGPRRTTPPIKVEEYARQAITGRGMSMSRLCEIFPDVENVESYISYELNQTIINFNFVDDSVQKVAICNRDIKATY